MRNAGFIGGPQQHTVGGRKPHGTAQTRAFMFTRFESDGKPKFLYLSPAKDWALAKVSDIKLTDAVRRLPLVVLETDFTACVNRNRCGDPIRSLSRSIAASICRQTILCGA